MIRPFSAFLAVLLLTLAQGPAADQPKWNVLFLISDDLRPELGCYGHPQVKTPNINALAARSLRFDHAFAQYPLCNPSRASMLTGRLPRTTGVLGNRTWFGDAHPDFISLPKFFRQQGYTTVRAGKIFHGGLDDTDAWSQGGESRKYGEGAMDPDEATPKVQPPAGTPSAPPAPSVSAPKGQTSLSPAEHSDRIIVLDDDGASHGDSKVADRAIAYLKSKPGGPFFLGCGFAKPHSPPTAPKRFFDLYDPDKIQLPPSFGPRPTAPSGFPSTALRKNSDLFIGRDASPKEARDYIRAYWASVSFVDWNIGRVLAALDESGLAKNTIIVFWGDHGYHLGEFGKWSKAGSLFDFGTRTPLLISVPDGTGQGKATGRVVSALDLYPTLTELAGLPAPAGLEGRSLVPLLRDPELAWPWPAFSVYSKDGKVQTGFSVRTERWRYTEFTGPTGGPILTDYANDPGETKNLAADPRFAEIRRTLSESLRQIALPAVPGK